MAQVDWDKPLEYLDRNEKWIPVRLLWQSDLYAVLIDDGVQRPFVVSKTADLVRNVAQRFTRWVALGSNGVVMCGDTAEAAMRRFDAGPWVIGECVPECVEVRKIEWEVPA